jgi:hypothetical protein
MMSGQPDLFQVVPTRRLDRLVTDPGNGGEHQANQKRDDSERDQDFE